MIGTAGNCRVLRRICARRLFDFVDLDIAMEPLQLNYSMPTIFVEEHAYQPYVEKVRAAAGSVPVLSVLGRVTRLSAAACEGQKFAGLIGEPGAPATIAEAYFSPTDAAVYPSAAG